MGEIRVILGGFKWIILTISEGSGYIGGASLRLRTRVISISALLNESPM